MNPNPNLADVATGEKFESLSDIQTSSNGTANENFWYAIFGHKFRPNTCKRNVSDDSWYWPPEDARCKESKESCDARCPTGDGVLEYSAIGTMSAHSIGRVTCPNVEGVDSKGVHPEIKVGPFHKYRSTDADGNELPGYLELNADVDNRWQLSVPHPFLSNAPESILLASSPT